MLHFGYIILKGLELIVVFNGQSEKVARNSNKGAKNQFLHKQVNFRRFNYRKK